MTVEALVDGAGLMRTLCTGLAVEMGSRLVSKACSVELDCHALASSMPAKRHMTVGEVPATSKCTSVPSNPLAVRTPSVNSPRSRENSGEAPD